MALAITNIGTNSNTSGSTVAVTVGVGGVPANSTILVGVTDKSGTGPGGSTTDSSSNTYLNIANPALAGSYSNGFLNVFRAQNAVALSNGNTITYTKAAGASNAAITACYISGSSFQRYDISVSSTGSGASSAPSVTSGSPYSANEMFVAFYGDANSGSFTQDTGNGWASPPNSTTTTAVRVAGGSQLNSGTGAKTYAPTVSAKNNWAIAILAEESFGVSHVLVHPGMTGGCNG